MLLMGVGVSGENGANVQKKPTVTEERRKGKENVTIQNPKEEERNALGRILIKWNAQKKTVLVRLLWT